MSSALVKEIRWVRDTYRPPATLSVGRDPVEFARSVGIEPDDWQTEVLASEHPVEVVVRQRFLGQRDLHPRLRPVLRQHGGERRPISGSASV